MAFNPNFTITNAITGALSRIERARGFLEAAKLSEDWIKEMQVRALVLEAYYTTHIEGTRLTLAQSEVAMFYASNKSRMPDVPDLTGIGANSIISP